MKILNPIRWMLAALLVIAFISCGKRTPKYVIGVSQCSEDIWRKKMNDELRIATLPHDNIELRIVSADDDVDKQIKQIDKLVEQGVDLLIVAPIQGDVA
ncbi:MAG: AraC family transcriptional regulator, partial [Prevotella pectinovora]